MFQKKEKKTKTTIEIIFEQNLMINFNEMCGKSEGNLEVVVEICFSVALYT